MCLVALSACGFSQTTAPAKSYDVPGTVALGEFPEPLSDRTPPPAPPTAATTSTTTTTEPRLTPIVGPIVDAVVGNRVLVIGDTVMAQTAPRNDGIMCDILNGFGWDVEIDAEPGRFVDFGQRVLDARLDPADGQPWDVGAVLLGSHFDGDLDAYRRELDAILDRLSPRPTIVYTLSEINPDAIAINEVIRALPSARPNVVIIEWAEATGLEPDLLLEDGGPKPTAEGAGRLVLFTAATLGRYPPEGGGECLPPAFTDDSAIIL
jgi:hypothetical protein